MTPDDPDPPDAGPDRSLVVASNRLPVVLERADGGWSVRPGSGGLVTALSPVLREHGGHWVGWPGVADVDADDVAGPLEELNRQRGYRLVPVELSGTERDRYYYGFSNEILWPLLHELPTQYRFDPAYWDAYRRVNRKFAGVLHRRASDDDLVWVHDYHLMGVARSLRERGRTGPTAYFLHTPFPARDLFLKLPWRDALVEGLLSYDLVGFQTLLDRDNFLDAVSALRPGARTRGEGRVVECRVDGRAVRTGAFPVSIDVEAFEELAAGAEVESRLRELRDRFGGRSIVLGVDRLDYTKGIPHRLDAFRTLLEAHPELRGEVSLVQVVVPSREGIPEYSDLKEQIEKQVGQINGQFSRHGWVPVHYYYRSLDRTQLAAYYRRADAALVTPLKDGMNLVAKEYCAAQVEGDGALVLSEFAGAAAQLRDGALLVNPFDVSATAKALHRALDLPDEERRRRMEALRAAVRGRDIFRWTESFLRAAEGRLDAGDDLPRHVPGARRDPDRGSGSG